MKRPSLILSERSFKEMLSDIFGKVFQEACCSYSHWAKKPLKISWGLKILKWKVRKFPTKNYSRQNVQYCWYVVIFSYSSFWRLKLKASEFIGVLVHLSLAIQFWFPSEQRLGRYIFNSLLFLKETGKYYWKKISKKPFDHILLRTKLN